MATTTPNFGWSVPTSTDLVKDGATAIETLGDAIDASLLDLKGGTTGQVLSKNSNTDMDFTWTAIDPLVILDAKGDLITATAADTPARLAVGTNGQVLTADSTASTGLAWATASAGSSNVAGKNVFLNSNFSIWQRGTSAALGASGVVTSADRWATYSGNATGTTLSRQLTSDTTNLPFIQYCGRIQRTAGQTDLSELEIAQSMETIDSRPFAGKVVTFSFYARKGANYSATSSAFNAFIRTGTGTDQSYGAGAYTGTATPLTTTVTLTTTWQRFTVSGTIAATATELAVDFRWTPTGTAGAADYAEVTGVQLEIGSSASAYSPNGATFQAELAACQRYYYRKVAPENFADMGLGFAISTTSVRIEVTFPVYMRVQPNALEYSTLTLYDGSGTSTAVTSAGLSEVNNQSTRITAGVASGLTQYRPYSLLANNSTSAYVGFNSEL